MRFERYRLREALTVDQLITFHYRELKADYDRRGEKHDFWEMAYVDKGVIDITCDSGCHRLRQGDLIFYAPNEFHRGQAAQDTSPNLVIITFDCDAPEMRWFQNFRRRLRKNEQTLLANVVRAGIEAFGPKENIPYKRVPPRPLPDAPFGADQLIKNYLEILLIELLRELTWDEPSKFAEIDANDNERAELVDQIVQYMEHHLSRALTLSHLCKQFSIGRTQMGEIFKNRFGIGTMEYCNLLIIDRAKRMIRQEVYNYSEIAEKLGYSSVHYFSKQFKKLTSMTPTEYARTVGVK